MNPIIALTLFRVVGPDEIAGSRFHLANIPIHEFSWWIVLWALALHTIVAVIITELMTRTYGKWYRWLFISFFIPVVGPIVILLYHLIAYESVRAARSQSFWERFLLSGPVSLRRAFLKEHARAQEVKLYAVRPKSPRSSIKIRDAVIEDALSQEKFGEARGQAWKMMEIARESKDFEILERYQDYLEIIADQESQNMGTDIHASSGGFRKLSDHENEDGEGSEKTPGIRSLCRRAARSRPAKKMIKLDETMDIR